MKITVIPQIKNQNNYPNYKPSFKAKIIRLEDAFILPDVLGKEGFSLQSLTHRFFGKNRSLHDDITSWSGYFPNIEEKLRVKTQNGFFLLSKKELERFVNEIDSAVAEAQNKITSSTEYDAPTSQRKLVQEILEEKGLNKELEKIVDETTCYNNKTELMNIVKQPDKEEAFENLLNEPN